MGKLTRRAVGFPSLGDGTVGAGGSNLLVRLRLLVDLDGRLLVGLVHGGGAADGKRLVVTVALFSHGAGDARAL